MRALNLCAAALKCSITGVSNSNSTQDKQITFKFTVGFTSCYATEAVRNFIKIKHILKNISYLKKNENIV
jgi:tRNA(Glu) U13 pseudouridine synthase TruD